MTEDMERILDEVDNAVRHATKLMLKSALLLRDADRMLRHLKRKEEVHAKDDDGRRTGP